MKSKRLYYGWIVLAMAFLSLLAAQGMRMSFQSFVLPWQEAFGSDRASLSLVSSISLMMYGLLGPVAGRLADRHGARAVMAISVMVLGFGVFASRFATSAPTLLLTYGVLASLGYAGASPVPATVVAARWFQGNRTMAMALIVLGFASGALLIAPFTVLIIQSWGWQQTLTVYGIGFMVIGVVVAILMRSDPAEVGVSGPGSAGLAPGAAAPLPPPVSIARVVRRREFWLLVFPYFVCGFSDLGFVGTHLVPFAQEHRVAAGLTAFALALASVVEVVGVLGSGYLADRWGRTRILATLYTIRLVGYGALFFIDLEPTLLLAFALGFGLTDLATIAPTGTLTTDLFGRGSVGTIFGWTALGHQVGAAIGAYVPGSIYDLTGSYTPAVVLNMALLGLAVAVTLITPTRNVLDTQVQPAAQVTGA